MTGPEICAANYTTEYEQKMIIFAACFLFLQEELARLERERVAEEERLKKEAEEKKRLAEEAEKEAERRRQEVDETKMVGLCYA